MSALPRLLLLAATLVATGARAALPLWELEGTASRIRLLGSIHFLRADDYPLPAPMDAAYREADVVVMELDLDDLEPAESAAVLQRLSVDPAGRDLEELLGAEVYREAAAKAGSIRIDLADFHRYEPWFVALQVTQLRLAQLGFDPFFGIEARLVARARSDGREIIGLETLEAQLGALDGLSGAEQRQFLMQTLDEAIEIESMLGDVLAAWRRGDTETLERDLLAGLAEQPRLYERILVDRNRAWAERIVALADDAGESYLVVVGALHLIGEDSVLALLEEAGIGHRQLQ